MGSTSQKFVYFYWSNEFSLRSLLMKQCTGSNKNLAPILNLALGPNQILRIKVKVTHCSMMFQGLATFSEV